MPPICWRKDARHRARRSGHGGANNDTKSPLYSTLDALNCLDNFGRTATYSEILEVTPGVSATFLDAGHILGSASIFLQLSEQGRSTSVLFSGDLGNAGRLLLRSPATPPRADNVVMETTYGDRLHKPLGPSIAELFEAINETFKRGGNVIIPTFAVERAQELLYFLERWYPQGTAARNRRRCSSIRQWRFRPLRYSDAIRSVLSLQPQSYFKARHDPFYLPGLHFTREAAESVALNNIHGGAIIMAGSGMCTGGRVRHHLQHNLGRDKSAIVFVGYAASGTLARRIIDGAKQVKIFGEDDSGQGAHLYHQRFLRPCRPGGIIGLAKADRRETHLSRPRRGRLQ